MTFGWSKSKQRKVTYWFFIFRAITKILGDWWANLDDKDQDPFKSLASNVSDLEMHGNGNG